MLYADGKYFDLERRYRAKWINKNVWIPAGNLSKTHIPLVPTGNCKFVFGPNIHIEKNYNQQYIDHPENVFLVPSEWVVKVAQKYLKHTQIRVFPYGIQIPNSQSLHKLNQIVVYLKGDTKSVITQNDIHLIEQFALTENFQIKYFHYGMYKKGRYFQALKNSRFAIWLGGTESQGLALLEAWSFDLPTLVRRKNTWTDHDGEIFSAEAAPYLNRLRGMYTAGESLSPNDLHNFYSQINSFSPQSSLVGELDIDMAIFNLKRIFGDS
jgi:hypothetical protein